MQSAVSPFRSTAYIKELFDEFRVDGVRRRLSAVLKGFSAPAWRRTFLDRNARQALRQVLSYVGNGRYASRKPR